jgi:hypothetical protein
VAAAELGCEGFDLAAGFVERAGAIYFLGGEKKFFLDGELCGDAAAGFRFAEAAGDEAIELLFGRAPGDDKPVQIFVDTGFNEQGGFDEDGVADTGAPPYFELAQDDFGDARVNDGVEAVEPSAVVENDSGKFAAVNAAVRGEYGLAKFLEDFRECRLAGLDEFVREGVGVEDGEAHFAQHSGYGAFAAGDAAGESESEHIFPITAWSLLIALPKIVVRRGGGARLLRCYS